MTIPGLSQETYARAKLANMKARKAKRQQKEFDDPVAWIEKYFHIPELNGPIELQPYQTAVLRESQRKDENGHFIYSIVVWSDIKKSAKSCIAAAMALYVARKSQWGSVKIVANDLKQADSRVAMFFRRAMELNPEFIEGKTYKQRGYTTNFLDNNSVVEAIPIDPGGEAGGNDDLIIFSELWAAKHKAIKAMWCFDEITEILTMRGWMSGVELSMSDVIATVNPDTHMLEWDRPTNINIKKYDGEMHLYESKTFSQCVTPNHRLYGIFAANSKDHPRAYHGFFTSEKIRSSLPTRVYYPLTAIKGFAGKSPEVKVINRARFKDEIRIEWGDWCEFMGWYLSEGNTLVTWGNKNYPDKKYPSRVCISQEPKVNLEKWWQIKELLTRIFGYDGFSILNRNTSFTIYHTGLGRELLPLGNSYTKFIPKEIKESKSEHLRRFFNAYILGDGHVQKNGTVQINCGSKRLSDDLCEIALKLGYTFSIVPRKYKGMKNITWRICIMDGKDGYTRILEKRGNPKRNHWKTIHYSGLVWCPSTKNGLVVTRRNGKVCIAGNSEMTLSPLKFGRSQRWIETYAGNTGEAPILEQLYHRGVKEGKRLNLSFNDHDLSDLEVYANGSLLCLWNDKPRCPWQTDAYYASEASVLLDGEFRRIHRNEWTSGIDTFVPPEWWDACQDNDISQMDKNEPLAVAMDAGVSSDNFGLVAVSKHPTIENHVVVRHVRRWIPPKGGTITFSNPDDKNDRDTPEGELRWLCGKYNVIIVPYDKYQLHDMATRFGKEGVAWMFDFSQGMMREVADSDLRTLIKERRLHHNGNPELTEHINNAAAKKGIEERKIRIVKKASHLKCDLAVALSMSCDRILYLNL